MSHLNLPRLLKGGLVAFCLLLGINTGAAHPGWGIVVAPDGSIYLTDLEQVWKIDAAGVAQIFVKDVHTHDLYLDAKGNLYGKHEWYVEPSGTFHHRYWRANPAGHIETISEKEASRFFDRWDADGNRYQTHSDREKKSAWISRTDRAGNSEVLAGGPWGHADGMGRDVQFRLFGTSKWGPDNCLYVTNDGMVRKVTMAGTVSTIAGPDQGFPASIQKNNGQPRYSALLGIAIDSERNVIVADIDQRKVFRITPDGQTEIILESGMGWLPSGVTLAGDDIYVLEYRTPISKPVGWVGKYGPRVRKIDKDGRISLVGVVG